MNIENKRMKGFTDEQKEAVRAVLAQLNGLSVAQAEAVLFASVDLLKEEVRIDIKLTTN